MRSKYGYASPAGKIELPFVGGLDANASHAPQRLENTPVVEPLQHFIRSKQSLNVFEGRFFQPVVKCFARIARR